jgi:hypothetical protein
VLTGDEKAFIVRGKLCSERLTMVRFAANIVAVDDSDDDFILVGFAEEQDGRYREALHFQRSYRFDERDLKLGMDQVYVERNDQVAGAYGGIERVELYPDSVRVVVSGRTAQELGDREFEIGLSLPPEEFEKLRQGLRIVFEGFGMLAEYPIRSDDQQDGGGR